MTNQTKEKTTINDNGMKHVMSLQEKAICLSNTGRRPKLPYPLKDVECAESTVQRMYEIPDGDKAKVLADLFPMTDGGASTT